jgi:uncharacterized protein YjbI with pentapeptide repeats
MRLTLKVFCLSLLAVALLAGSATSFASQSTNIGKGTKRCVPEPGADCRGVVERWTVEHHGDLRKAKFTGAVLHGADFRGADLRGADFRGAKLHHADLRGANLKGARFDRVKRVGKNTKQGSGEPSCYPNCQGANLSGAELGGANLDHANLSYAFLNWADLTFATLRGANLNGSNLSYTILNAADLTNAYLYGTNLSGADLTGATGCSTVTPSGTLNGLGCAN